MQNSQEIKQKIRRRRRRKAILTGAAALLIVCGALDLLAAVRSLGKETQTAPEQEQTLASVVSGSISQTVFASGSIMPASQPGVYAKTDGTVASVLAQMGDAVKAGDVLMELKNEELASEAEQLEYELLLAQDAVEAVKTYSRYTYRPVYDADGKRRMDVDTGEPLMAKYSNELAIRAPGAGRVVAVYIEPGDDALAVYREKGAVAVLSTDGYSKVELTGLTPGALNAGDTVRVKGIGVNAEGTVENVARRGMDATILVEGDEYGMDVPVNIYTADDALLCEGVLTVNKPLMVSAYGGQIRSVAAKVGQMVEDDEILAHFTWTGTPLYIDNASVLRDYAVAQASLDAVRAKMDALTVVAPCDGTVASVDVDVDGEVKSGARLMTLVEDAGMNIVLAVDELDIPQVCAEQRVTLSVDALEELTIEGAVEKIAPIGDTQTGVTTFDVYIRAEEIDERVLGGMNVTGEITTQTAEDALLVPTDALRKDEQGYYVTMESGERREIEIGIMSVEWTQVLSGLSMGETVVQ